MEPKILRVSKYYKILFIFEIYNSVIIVYFERTFENNKLK